MRVREVRPPGHRSVPWLLVGGLRLPQSGSATAKHCLFCAGALSEHPSLTLLLALSSSERGRIFMSKITNRRRTLIAGVVTPGAMETEAVKNRGLLAALNRVSTSNVQGYAVARAAGFCRPLVTPSDACSTAELLAPASFCAASSEVGEHYDIVSAV